MEVFLLGPLLKERKSLQKNRLFVVILSLAIAVAGVAILSLDRIHHHPVQLWDDLLLVYGGVFIVFLLFDSVGKQIAGFRKEKDMTIPRPKPSPSAEPARRAYVPPGRVEASDVRLERVKPDSPAVARLQNLCNAAFEELAALEGTMPVRNSTGDVMNAPVSEWITDATRYLFFIQHQQKSVGCVVLRKDESTLHVDLVYVVPDVRRQRVGRVSITKVVEFVELMGGHDSLWLEIGPDNARGHKFAKSSGFHHADEPENTGNATYVLGLDV